LLPEYSKKIKKVDLKPESMKIRVSAIGPRGLKINDIIPLEPLNARMNEGRENDIIFTEAPQVDLKVALTATGAEVQGQVRTKYRQPCGLCAETIERTLETGINLILQPAPEDAPEPDIPGEDDGEDGVGLAYYHGDEVEMEGLIQEALILALSPFWHPPLDAQGRCTQCGKGFNKENPAEPVQKVSLGSLLKKAGVNLP
jgi:hypothetical protein